MCVIKCKKVCNLQETVLTALSLLQKKCRVQVNSFAGAESASSGSAGVESVHAGVSGGEQVTVGWCWLTPGWWYWWGARCTGVDWTVV